MITTIQKISGDWTADYIKNGVNCYVTHAKTKEALMIKLIEMVVEQNV